MSEKNNAEMKKSSRPGGGMLGGGPMKGMMEKSKVNDFKGTLIKLIKYLGSHTIAIFITILLAVGSTILMIQGPKILGTATTEIFTGIISKIAGGKGIDFDAIAKIMISLVILYCISMVLSYIQGWTMTGIAMKITYKFRRDISEKINRMPLKYFTEKTHGEVLSRITNDVDIVSQTLNQSLTQIITSITQIIGVLIMMLSISPEMTLIALTVIPLSLFSVMLLVKFSQKHFKKQQEYLGNINGHVEEMYSGHVIIKAFNGEDESIRKFKQYNKKLYSSAMMAQFLSGLMMPLMNFIGNLGYVAVCILGGYFAAKGKIEVGNIQAFIQYIRQFTQPISQIANISNVLQSTVAAAERVFEFLDEEEETDDSSAPVTVNVAEKDGKITFIKDGESQPFNGSVQFENIKFAYPDDNVTVIHGFSACVKPGQRIAIVGPTGGGKTTMVKLLMRFYDVNEGAITIDGNDIRDVKRNELRSMFGMVLQETWLYNGSIMENIRYGKLNATDKDVITAAKAAHVDHFVSTLPNGYNMELNEESSNVSQGQKQLITIARAILADPKILILDEATSSVDTRTEILIQQAMEHLMNGRTSFIIAHRLSTIRNADLILVVNNGDICEQGTHDELLNANGFYANLWTSQFALNS